jgi:hypothetical protein
MRLRIAFKSRCTPKKRREGATRTHSNSFAKWLLPLVGALQNFAQPIVRQRFDAMIIATDHCLIINEGVDDCLFGCLHDTSENRVQTIIRNCLDRVCQRFRIRRTSVRG